MASYISAADACERWGVSLRQAQRLLSGNRVPGAKKHAGVWMIPVDARKPPDPRRAAKLPPESLRHDLAEVIAGSTVPMPARDPDAILEIVTERRLQLQYEGELAYLRGDFERTMRCYDETGGDDAARLRACPVAVAAAISMGDYRAYTRIDAYLKNHVEAGRGGVVASLAELALATASVSAVVPDMAPEWLKKGDLSALPPQARPDALYLRAKYFHSVGDYSAMLAVAQTALAFLSPQEGIMPHDIYLHVTCAAACHVLGRGEDARKWLLAAMRIALPHGFVTPFAEIVTAFGGLMEQCLRQEFPAYYSAVLEQWKRTWKNWMVFHNQFTKDNITLVLTLREYHIAILVARRVPYAQIAAQHCISVGRLKNIMQGVYGKLLISGRDELARYVL